jgi:hypothetical protein
MAKPPGKQEITKDDIEGWSASKTMDEKANYWP